MRAIFLFFFLFIAVMPFAGRAQNKPVFGPPEQESTAVITKKESAWALRCAQDQKGNPGACEIFQRLVDGKTGQRIAEFAIGFPENTQIARGVAIFPLGVLFDPAATLQVDDKQTYKFNLRYCETEGCYAYVDLTPEILAMMKAGKVLTFTMSLHEGGQTQLQMKLSGFSASYEGLK